MWFLLRLRHVQFLAISIASVKGWSFFSSDHTLQSSSASSASSSTTTKNRVRNRKGCKDEEQYSFQILDDTYQGCSWIIEDPEQTQTRVAYYCAQPEIKFKCANTCNACDIECGDDSEFLFNPTNFPVEGLEQPCIWITSTPSIMDSRRDAYCLTDIIKASCPYSCGYCQDTAPPSLSVQPSASLRPSFRPSAYTTPCTDDGSYEFETDDGSLRNCPWLSQSEEQIQGRIQTYCTRSRVKYMCAYTCATCGEACIDNLEFRFETQALEEQNFQQSCDWIASESSKVMLRRDENCRDENVELFCPYSCGYCPNTTDDSESSNWPSTSPQLSGRPNLSIHPTISETPSSAPFELPCDDDDA
eukprot:CAMPEP_0194079716 /NCGR_PEP_ID=MMETSP0149-20130528/5864_1 /TAXON_ID=122233 /ORGANISM="Chaetoceros debilis, Strain MM31A-1" /LENGTH=358 /DNA_ID=CAMNT_0038761273 /DNA_START=131 /DNA_END=1203 /DNA_ORIENTATION=+